MARHEADAVAGEPVPQPHAAVARPRGHVVVVRVEGEAVHVGEVAHEDAHALRLLRRPQPHCCFERLVGEVLKVILGCVGKI